MVQKEFYKLFLIALKINSKNLEKLEIALLLLEKIFEYFNRDLQIIASITNRIFQMILEFSLGFNFFTIPKELFEYSLYCIKRILFLYHYVNFIDFKVLLLNSHFRWLLSVNYLSKTRIKPITGNP